MVKVALKLIEFLKTILSFLIACAKLFTNSKSITFIALGFNLCRLVPKELQECSLDVSIKFNYSTEHLLCNFIVISFRIPYGKY